MRQAERVRYYAGKGYYGRAVKFLLSAKTAYLCDSDFIEAIRAFQPEPIEPAIRILQKDFSPAPALPIYALKKTSKKMDETSANGLDGMSVLRLRMCL